MDSWIDFTAQEVELPATLWLYPVIGYLPASSPAVTEKAKADLAHALSVGPSPSPCPAHQALVHCLTCPPFCLVW